MAVMKSVQANKITMGNHFDCLILFFLIIYLLNILNLLFGHHCPILKPDLELSLGATKLVGHFNSSMHHEVVISCETPSPAPESGNRCKSNGLAFWGCWSLWMIVYHLQINRKMINWLFSICFTLSYRLFSIRGMHNFAKLIVCLFLEYIFCLYIKQKMCKNRNQMNKQSLQFWFSWPNYGSI